MSVKSRNGVLEWIRILGEKIIIELKDKVDADNNYGSYNPHDRKITIKKGLGLETTRRIRVHEKMHALLDISGATALISTEIEESICEMIESGYKVFKDEIMEEYKLIEKSKTT